MPPKLERRCKKDSPSCDPSYYAPFHRRIFYLWSDSMKKDYYFSTKDLLFIAGFSAIGGVASTYINMIGDFFQSLLGFAGTTQWAAGLHVLWILLAVHETVWCRRANRQETRNCRPGWNP